MTASDSNLRDSLRRMLMDLCTATKGIDGATLAKSDGLIISSWSPKLSDASLAAAMSAALLNIGGNVLRNLELGDLKRVVVSGNTGDIVLARSGKDMILSVFIRKEASLGMTFLELNRTNDKIFTAMSEREG